jgi:hypothetical protein
LNLQETNRLLQFLRDIDYKLSKPVAQDDPTYIDLTFKDDYPPFSIFTMEHDTEVFYPPRPNPKAKKAPGEVFFTNGGQTITAASGTPTTVSCHALGSHRPHLIRYNFTGTHPVIGDRLAPPSGQSYLEISSSGPFMAVSVPDTTEAWIWVIFNPTTSSSTPPSSALPLGYATLTQAMCTTDATATVSSPKYFDSSAISAVTSVGNTFKHQGKIGDLVLINFINFGSGGVWTVVDVIKVARGMMYDMAFGYVQGETPDFIDSCAIKQGLHYIAVEECSVPTFDPVAGGDYFPGILLYIHELPYTYEVPSRATEDTIRDTAQDACAIKAKTKKFCMFQETPEDGADKTVASLTAKTFLKKIYKDTECIASQTKPIINADIQTVYVVCFDTPIEETQIVGVKCSGTYSSC